MAKSKVTKSGLLKDAIPQNRSGNYDRIFGDEDLGYLMSQVQSVAIKAGHILEDIIASKTNLIPDKDLDAFVDDCNNTTTISGTFLCTKDMAKKSHYHVNGHEPDLMIFQIENGRGKCYIVELKAGSDFDTKKSDGEVETLEKCRAVLGPALPFITEFYLCAFHAVDKQEIVKGLKGRFAENEVMTGRELCNILDIDYDEVVREESKFERDNTTYFTRKVTTNAKAKTYRIPEDEFYSDDTEDDGDDV